MNVKDVKVILIDKETNEVLFKDKDGFIIKKLMINYDDSYEEVYVELM